MSNQMWYALDVAGNPVPSEQPYSKNQGNRHAWQVGIDVIGDTRVSTVFLSLDHNWGDGPPLLFETMVFPDNGWTENYCERYATRAEAEAGHVKAVEMVRSGKCA